MKEKRKAEEAKKDNDEEIEKTKKKRWRKRKRNLGERVKEIKEEEVIRKEKTKQSE